MDRLFKKLTIVASLVCIVFLGLAAIEENFLREWKHYQNEFADILMEPFTVLDWQRALFLEHDVVPFPIGDCMRGTGVPMATQRCSTS